MRIMIGSIAGMVGVGGYGVEEICGNVFTNST